MKLSRMADYGVTLATVIARQPESLHTVPVLAQKTGLGEATVSKVLKNLTRFGLLNSVRGANGGYCLAMGPERITMGHIIEAVDGPIALTRCIDHTDDDNCAIESLCGTKDGWTKINAAIKKAFDDVTLAEMAHLQKTTMNNKTGSGESEHTHA